VVENQTATRVERMLIQFDWSGKPIRFSLCAADEVDPQ
jgi:hypothetical protein